MYKLARRVVIALLLLITWYWIFYGKWVGPSHSPLQQLTDKKTGHVIELVYEGKRTTGGDLYAVYAYLPQGFLLDNIRFGPPVISLQAASAEALNLTFDGRCYVLTAKFRHLFSFSGGYGDPFSGFICFKLNPSGPN